MIYEWRASKIVYFERETNSPIIETGHPWKQVRRCNREREAKMPTPRLVRGGE